MIERRRGVSVQVLMGAFNGAPHLPAQLESIAAQEGVDWQLTVSDDGSTDCTGALIDRFAADYAGRVERRLGPRAGCAANFLSLLARAEDGVVALADQDDIWLRGKLARALYLLGEVPPDVPALYTARRWLWWPKAALLKPDALAARQPGFGNALIENIAPGNTVVLNPAAVRLARETAQLADGVFAHDWWLYLLITGAGGHIVADPARVLLYRQHGGNLIGAGHGVAAQMRRKRAVLRGAFRERVADNLAALHRCHVYLTPGARAQLRAFRTAHAAGLVRRIWHLGQARPYRQNAIDSAGFWGAAILGKV
ncbi:glycosyltransferase [Roseovarius sp. LXJ103]|uniref:glycosyltransferase n=1 Tax=Roseovarius carneus TaxID=2853164 RepID=UPI000D6159E9|nr:glycosyltransferase [Roseovarius carneus]MBZ8117985.1 glycosyltransferase [Roseovarius carneus]PWE36265.1 glycosyl transferase family 2 [Pelagicola sp. LXJ1103]